MDHKKDKLPPRSDSHVKGAPTARLFLRMKKLCSFGFSLFVISFLGLFLSAVYLRSQALPVAIVEQTSQIIDAQGQQIDSFHSGQNRQLVSLEDISKTLVQATLAAEDRRFYQHIGFDLKGIARAAVVNLTHRRKVQGASTLTMQLAENLYLSHDRSWSVKLKETVYALQLEMQYSKDEILEQYLNQIYYGHATYGIQTAAQVYFNKDAKDLNLAESALLAGVPKGPKYYSPYMNMDNAKSRQQIVLQAMVDNEYITQQAADLAFEEPLTFMPLVGSQPSEAPYFRDYIRYLAVEKLGIAEDLLNQGGIKVYTTLDLRAQKIAEEVIAQHLEKDSELQVALIALDPRTGHIKAMVGGKNYGENQFNRVFATTRQPGSAFKPFVYLTALQQEGFSAVTRYRSEPTVFTYDEGRETYTPSNFDNRYANEFIDLRQAISRSDNIYAVHTLMNVGADRIINTARSLGIDSPMKPLPSLALGTFPISPFEMASAFGVIANQGIRVEPMAIIRIVASDGNVLYEAQSVHNQVIEPAYTYVLTHLMQSVFDQGGTASRVAPLLNRPVAGKTGTTNTDAWMVGFTPELSTAVWIGYDRDRNITALESHLAAPIFAEFTEKALEPIPPKIFPISDGAVSVYIDSATGKLATENCPLTRLESFVRGTEPSETCTEHEATDSDPIELQVEKQERTWWADLKRWWNE